jgi:hypothetical protein
MLLRRILADVRKVQVEELSAWMAGRRAAAAQERTGAALAFRDHAAFLNSYVPEDEGLYNDAKGR